MTRLMELLAELNESATVTFRFFPGPERNQSYDTWTVQVGDHELARERTARGALRAAFIKTVDTMFDREEGGF